MGCDIHLTIEVQHDDGTWHGIECPPAPPRDANGESIYDDAYWKSWGCYRSYKEERGNFSPEYSWSFGRNYSCFALMTGVRNGDGVTPIAVPKGFPPDASTESIHEYCLKIVPDEEDDDNEEHTTTQSNASKWLKSNSSVLVAPGLISEPDWHSASYLTLTELNAVNEKKIQCAAVLTLPEYEKFKSRKPQTLPDLEDLIWYNIRVSEQREYRRVDKKEMNEILRLKKHPLGAFSSQEKVYIEIKGRHPEPKQFSRLFELRDIMREIQQERQRTPDQIRIVFYFDN